MRSLSCKTIKDAISFHRPPRRFRAFITRAKESVLLYAFFGPARVSDYSCDKEA